MERIQEAQAPAAEADAEPVPPSRDPARLPLLISEVAVAPEADKQYLAGEINALLEAMRAPGNEAAEAKVVLSALELQSLDGLFDEKGKSCRAEAVETLLACGFPHALAVSPEELEHRNAARARFKRGPLALLGLGAGVVVVLIALASAKGSKADWVEPVFYLVLVAGGLLQTVFRAAFRSDGKPKP